MLPMTLVAPTEARVSPLVHFLLYQTCADLKGRVALGLDWRLKAIEMKAINHKMALDSLLSEVQKLVKPEAETEPVSIQMIKYFFFKSCLPHS